MNAPTRVDSRARPNSPFALRSEDIEAVAQHAAEMAHPLFVHHGWTYDWGRPHVPTVDDLRRCIVGLVERCEPDFGDANSSGRFYVERRPEGVEVHLNLGTVYTPTEAEQCGSSEARP